MISNINKHKIDIKKQTIILDYDGTLLDNMGPIIKSHKECWEKYCKNWTYIDFLTEIEKIALKKTKWQNFPVNAIKRFLIKRRISSSWKSLSNKKMSFEFFPKTIELLSSLSKYYNIIVVTNKISLDKDANFQLINDLLSMWFTRSILGFKKETKSGSDELKKQLINYNLNNTVVRVIGDSWDDYILAKNLNYPFVGIAQGLLNQNYFERMGYQSFQTLIEWYENDDLFISIDA